MRLVQCTNYPSPVGWTVIAWNLIWLIIQLIISPDDVYFSIVYNIMPFLVGIPLLMRG